MRIAITGANGQLGQALLKLLTEQGETVIPTDVPDFDITDYQIVQKLSNLRPELIIHAAAMTNVDGCAKDPDLAFRVNAFGAQNVAHACLRCNADLVCVSTNEVFDGSAGRPYREDDPTNPINPYGSSKRAGEQMAARYLNNKLYIVRTAWLYAPGGNNFPAKIIAGADAHRELRVVTDEIGNPTYAPDLAEAIGQLIRTRVYGIYHFVNAGHCSRYDFAKEILRLSGRGDIPIRPITLADYPRASTVPPFAPLVNTRGAELGIELRPWPEALGAYFEASGAN
ncbi:MAG: dTDP-4-dehydrorhamnose reductase [Anaerolineae bacterium]|nr:dTDP-4-dehydrorhamnose reductase [Anaerolineae bacterium]